MRMCGDVVESSQAEGGNEVSARILADPHVAKFHPVEPTPFGTLQPQLHYTVYSTTTTSLVLLLLLLLLSPL